jgi:hypothetical protein
MILDGSETDPSGPSGSLVYSAFVGIFRTLMPFEGFEPRAGLKSFESVGVIRVRREIERGPVADVAPVVCTSAREVSSTLSGYRSIVSELCCDPHGPDAGRVGAVDCMEDFLPSGFRSVSAELRAVSMIVLKDGAVTVGSVLLLCYVG